jgi:branched-chain amino acid transport system substrate-binding protein
MVGKPLENLSRREMLRLGAYAGAGALVLPSLAACGGLDSPGSGQASGAAGKEGILLGVLDSLTGVYAASGKNEIDGITLAVNEVNKAGGVLGGRQVKIVQRDDGTKPDVGVRGVRELVQQENVDMLVGVLSSGVALAVSEAAYQFGVPFICSGAHDDQLTGAKANKTTFRFTVESTMIARAVAPYIVEKGGKNWFFVTADYAYGIGAENAMTAELTKLGGRVVSSEHTPLGTTDFSAQLTKARNSGASAVVLVLYGPDLVAATKQFSEFGLGQNMYLGGHLQGPEMAVGIGSAAMHGIYGCAWDGSLEPQPSKQFFDQMKAAIGGTPNWRHYLGYMSAREGLQAIDRAGTTSAAEVVKALEGHKFDPLKGGKGYWRDWDHQAITDVAVIEAIPEKDWSYPGQYFKVVKLVDGDSVSRTEAENAEGKKRLASQTIPQRANYTAKTK